jgi:dihydroorotate dehydrogenase (fumarate)
VIDTESESVVIKPKDGFGGIGGDYVLPTALANVNAFYRRCPDKRVIGCGGVKTGEHVFQHLLAGASLVQVGTALQEEGAGIFARLNTELAALMARKGYASIEAVRGKLKTL